MSGVDRDAAARLLRQRIEVGGPEIFLDGLSRAEALELARAARAGGAEASGRGTDRPAGRPLGTPPPVTSAKPSAKPSAKDSAKAAVKPAATPGELPVLPDSHDELRDVALGCMRCRLSGTRTQVVFADGVPDARLIVVGEAPGANEDEIGLPFVGAAGKFLDLLLATVGLSRRESVYICNVLKCRPPGNRNPMPDEIEACAPYLRKQIDLVRPEALLAVGSFSGQLLTGRDKVSLGKLRGEVHGYHGVPLVVTYHPAALLRNPNWTPAFWDDLQLLRSILDRGLS